MSGADGSYLVLSEYLGCTASVVGRAAALEHPVKIQKLLETLIECLQRMADFAVSTQNRLPADARVLVGNEIHKVVTYLKPVLDEYFGLKHLLWEHICSCLFDLYSNLSGAAFDTDNERKEVKIEYIPMQEISKEELKSLSCDRAAVKRLCPLPATQFADAEDRCSMCCELPDKAKTCGACRRVKYCDALCQKSHWPWHKEQCKKYK